MLLGIGFGIMEISRKYYISTVHEDLPVKSSLSFIALRGGCTGNKRMQNVLEDRSCAATCQYARRIRDDPFRCVLRVAKDYFIRNVQCDEQIHSKSNKILRNDLRNFARKKQLCVRKKIKLILNIICLSFSNLF